MILCPTRLVYVFAKPSFRKKHDITNFPYKMTPEKLRKHNLEMENSNVEKKLLKGSPENRPSSSKVKEEATTIWP
jgi:hypothetical protein